MSVSLRMRWCGLALATAACCLLVVSVVHHGGAGARALLGPCSDSTICSKYALLRHEGRNLPHAQRTGPRSAQRESAGEDSRVAAATGGFSFPGLGAGLVLSLIHI